MDPSGHVACPKKYKQYRKEGYTAVEAGIKSKYGVIKKQQGKAAADAYRKEQVKKLTENGYQFSDAWKKGRNGYQNPNYSSRKGRSGKQKRLREIANDNKVSSALRGEIICDINEIKRGKRKNIRVPSGYQLAHRRGYEARNGFGYEHSDLNTTDNHKRQHKIDGYGRRNK